MSGTLVSTVHVNVFTGDTFPARSPALEQQAHDMIGMKQQHEYDTQRSNKTYILPERRGCGRGYSITPLKRK